MLRVCWFAVKEIEVSDPTMGVRIRGHEAYWAMRSGSNSNRRTSTSSGSLSYFHNQ